MKHCEETTRTNGWNGVHVISGQILKGIVQLDDYDVSMIYLAKITCTVLYLVYHTQIDGMYDCLLCLAV